MPSPIRYRADAVVTCDDAFTVHRPGLVEVEDGRIVWVGSDAGDRPAVGNERRLSGLLMPGLVNVHCHSPMTIFRGAAEDVPLHPPYALITAGSSLHWMDWEVALPRFADVLTPNGSLAICNLPAPHEPWGPAIRAIIPRYSTNPDFAEFDLIGELARRNLFEKRGEYTTEPVPLVRSVADYIEWFHSMSSFSRDLMTPEAAIAFDAEIHDAIAPSVRDGLLNTHIIGHVVWGKPLRKL